jgi:hypothetical protein
LWRTTAIGRTEVFADPAFNVFLGKGLPHFPVRRT